MTARRDNVIPFRRPEPDHRADEAERSRCLAALNRGADLTCLDVFSAMEPIPKTRVRLAQPPTIEDCLTCALHDDCHGPCMRFDEGAS